MTVQKSKLMNSKICFFQGVVVGFTVSMSKLRATSMINGVDEA